MKVEKDSTTDMTENHIRVLEGAGYTFEYNNWSDRYRCDMWGFIVPERMAHGGFKRVTLTIDQLKDEAKLYE